MQKCSHCGIELNPSNWYLIYQKIQRNICKDCELKYRRDWYQKNKERLQARGRDCYQKDKDSYIQRSKVYYVKHREEIRKKAHDDHLLRRKKAIEHYGGKCACCGATLFEFLTIDHIDGHGNQHRREHGGDSATNFYLWLEKNNYPDGFQVLCWNCNCSKGIYGFCPHNR